MEDEVKLTEITRKLLDACHPILKDLTLNGRDWAGLTNIFCASFMLSTLDMLTLTQEEKKLLINSMTTNLKNALLRVPEDAYDNADNSRTSNSE